MILKRFYMGNDYTQGMLNVNGRTFFTLERPWLNNQVNVSCIPEGVYHIYTFKHPRLGEVIGLDDVPDRTEILIHPGNYVKNSQGCILPGLNAGRAKVLNSKAAMNDILQNRAKDYIEIENLVEVS